MARKRPPTDKTETIPLKRPTPDDIANINYQDIYEKMFKVIITIKTSFTKVFFQPHEQGSYQSQVLPPVQLPPFGNQTVATPLAPSPQSSGIIFINNITVLNTV